MKQSTKDVYEILGVRQNASRDEIIKRYDTLLKKYRVSRSEGSDKSGEEVDIDEINHAYNQLMGYESQQEEVSSREPNLLLKKLDLDEKKVGNFFYYYKFHIIISIIAVILLVFTIKGCLSNVKPDLSVVFIGDFYQSETEALSQDIKNKIPGLKAVEVVVIPVTQDAKSEQAYAARIKAMAYMMGGDIDICISDKLNFEDYGMQGAFISLDELADSLKLDKDKNRNFILKPKDQKAEHLYGVDVSSNDILNKSGILGKERIASIRIDAKHHEAAVNALKLFAK